ncbi:MULTISPECIES: SGNH/GDSL hydrolase family protein [unclassified Pseudofrankia]|uniref:SGNH/GDSL hydrolase family protein n=1 Tax=unclassified Pseudofrankia TaxID=2994372 RepID=UPI0008DA6032|nr:MULTISPECIES: SGNH/GDSL hydrolase family protein [unclassified Pseudofrankia]MDT3442948.1 SGNH/GDSL hydrolase family protein [Pseudofrankia sp. BMG5.37]OHV42986.1 G-D-S-L family lipolytic protein [Pseudofrankia sp. BMG5.36]
MSGQKHRWTAAWTTSPQRPGAGFAPNWSEEGFADQTIRQVVRLSIGGETLRIRLSNRYGTLPLRVTGLTVAVTVGGAAVKPNTLRELTVGGNATFTVPAGSDLATDGVAFPADALDSVTVTAYLAEPSGPATYHAQALATAYRATGDHRADPDDTAFTETSQSWYYLVGVDVAGAQHDGIHDDGNHDDGIVVFGDSLTDGTGSTQDTNHRFPDQLSRRLVAAGMPRAVLNQGIGGNRVMVDSPWLGDRATTRFHRDVLTQPGVNTVMIFAGINDIGISEVALDSPFPVLAPFTEVSAEEVIAGHRDMARRARATGLRTVGVTLLPIRGSAFSTPSSEAKRTTVNAWIHGSGEYDTVIDLALAMGDALDPTHDSGDHLHPNDAGYQAMADAIDLTLL